LPPLVVAGVEGVEEGWVLGAVLGVVLGAVLGVVLGLGAVVAGATVTGVVVVGLLSSVFPRQAVSKHAVRTKVIMIIAVFFIFVSS